MLTVNCHTVYYKFCISLLSMKILQLCKLAWGAMTFLQRTKQKTTILVSTYLNSRVIHTEHTAGVFMHVEYIILTKLIKIQSTTTISMHSNKLITTCQLFPLSLHFSNNRALQIATNEIRNAPKLFFQHLSRPRVGNRQSILPTCFFILLFSRSLQRQVDRICRRGACSAAVTISLHFC